jgi:hypothetical protein
MGAGLCARLRTWLDNTFRADMFLAVPRRILMYYMTRVGGAGESDVERCFPELGVLDYGDVIVLWRPDELVRELVAAAREHDNPVVAEVYKWRETE